MSLAEEARSVRQRIAERLHELEPLAREYEELKQIAADMGIELDEDSGKQPRPPGRSSSSTSRPAPKTRAADAGTPRTGDLAARVLGAVRAQPGKTVGEYAAILNVSQTALYRPVRELTNQGMVVKRARQLFPE